MWIVLTSAWAVPVSVGDSFSTAETFADLMSLHENTPELEITVRADMAVPNGGVVFANQTAVTITSTTSYDEPRVVAVSGNSPLFHVPNGSLDVQELRIARQGGGRGVVLQGADLTLTAVLFDQVDWDGTGMVVATSSLVAGEVWVCGGTSPNAPVFVTDGTAALSGVRVEGASSSGWVLDAAAGGSVVSSTVWGALGGGFYGPGLSLTSTVIATSGTPAEGTAGAPLSLSSVHGTGTAVHVGSGAFEVGQEADLFYAFEPGAHCGRDARPRAGGPLWSDAGDHVGAYHFDLPEPGWDDDDADGYGYGVDCADAVEAIHPGAIEVCFDGIDQDCVAGPDGGAVSNGVTGYPDADGDEGGDYYGDTVDFCDAATLDSAGYVANADDCDDMDPSSLAQQTFYEDTDGDSYPAEDKVRYGCEPAPNWESAPADGVWDCNDGLGAWNPGASEDCAAARPDEVDADCDGLVVSDDPDCLVDTGSPIGDDDDDDDGPVGDDDDDDDDDGGTGLGRPSLDPTLTPAAPGCACSAGAPGGAGGVWFALVGLGGLLRRRPAGGSGASTRDR